MNTWRYWKWTTPLTNLWPNKYSINWDNDIYQKVQKIKFLFFTIKIRYEFNLLISSFFFGFLVIFHHVSLLPFIVSFAKTSFSLGSFGFQIRFSCFSFLFQILFLVLYYFLYCHELLLKKKKSIIMK